MTIDELKKKLSRLGWKCYKPAHNLCGPNFCYLFFTDGWGAEIDVQGKNVIDRTKTEPISPGKTEAEQIKRNFTKARVLIHQFANTPIKDRKPKPKKYVAIIGQDSDDGDVFVYWTLTDRPNGDLFIGDVYSPTLCEDDYYLTLRQIHQLRMYCKKHEIPQPVVKSVDEFKKEMEK